MSFLSKAIIAVLPLLSVACINDNDEPAWSLTSGERLPQFTITMNDGSTLTTDDLSGQTSVIVLFSTSCSDCRAALPDIQAAYDGWGNEVKFICISREESAPAIEAYWEENHYTLPYSAQTTRKIYSLFATSGIPRIYVAGEDLIIQEVYSPEDL